VEETKQAIDVIWVDGEGEEKGFFLVCPSPPNGQSSRVKVNGAVCVPPPPAAAAAAAGKESSFSIGPMPAFAVVEVGEEVVVFWFGGREWVEYMPTPQIEVGKEVEGKGNGKGVSDAEILGETGQGIGEGEGEGEKGEAEKTAEERSLDALFEEPEGGEAGAVGKTPSPQPSDSLPPPPTLQQQRQQQQQHQATWAQIFRQRLHHHQHTNPPKPPNYPPKPHQIRRTSMLDDQDVILGIATVWAALLQQDQGSRFAFAASETYQFARNVDVDPHNNGAPLNTQIRAPVCRQHDLLIPLIILPDWISPPNSARPNPANEAIKTPVPPPPPPPPPQKKKKPTKKVTGKEQDDSDQEGNKPKGHIILAIAQRQPTHPPSIHTLILDSCPGYITANRLSRSIRKTVCQIGWEHLDPSTGFALPLADEPVFTATHAPVPTQEGIDTCGISTILNAWVHMLNLPRLGRLQRARYGNNQHQHQHQPPLWPGVADDNLPEAARRIVNLALRGRMDLLTIQAFLNASGYCALQDPKGASVRLPAGQTTAPMTTDTLDDLLQAQRQIENTLVTDREAVMAETGCTADEAEAYLDSAGGNVGVAVESYRAMNG
ncbi:MAG: hypothetical protein Q9207_007784, partial [Kuettlingeria erythrocarpa]